jgi:hypothetical protein
VSNIGEGNLMSYALVVFSVLVLAAPPGTLANAIVNTAAAPQVVSIKKNLPLATCTSDATVINNSGAPDILDAANSYGIAFKANCLPEF